eukprot:2923024-Rhodomonas_salina.1
MARCSHEPSPELFSRRAAVISTLPVLVFGLGKHASAASSAEQTGLDKQSLKGDYDRYSADYEKLDGGPLANALGISNARAEMLSRARGNVLEVGVGTGLNLPGYRYPLVSASSSSASLSSSPLPDHHLVSLALFSRVSLLPSESLLTTSCACCSHSCPWSEQVLRRKRG